jgi:phospholipase/lecithinase/hemolysin
MPTFTRRSLHSLAATLLTCTVALFASSSAADAQPARQVVIFGDSLSDPGNGFDFVKANATPPDYGLNPLLIPSAPYAQGGHHLSNGPTWIEQLAAATGAGLNAQPAFVGSNPFAMNFAIGSASAGGTGLPSLSFEVAAFLQKTGGQVPSDALYVIEFGGIDVRQAVATGDPVQGLAILQAAATAIRTNISLLHSLGARHFLVWNVPDAGLTPTARLTGTQAAASLATQTFNGLLAAELTPLVLSGIDIIGFDANALVTSIVNNPAAFGLSNVVDACVTPNVAPFTCQQPDQYLFWDGIHPTAAAHAIVAGAVAQLLGL